MKFAEHAMVPKFTKMQMVSQIAPMVALFELVLLLTGRRTASAIQRELPFLKMPNDSLLKKIYDFRFMPARYSYF